MTTALEQRAVSFDFTEYEGHVASYFANSGFAVYKTFNHRLTFFTDDWFLDLTIKNLSHWRQAKMPYVCLRDCFLKLGPKKCGVIADAFEIKYNTVRRNQVYEWLRLLRESSSGEEEIMKHLERRHEVSLLVVVMNS